MAEENELSTKEVQRIFLNKVASDLGFKCDHLRIGFAKDDPDHKPYCKDCWTRLRTVKPPTCNGKKIVKKGEFESLETFLDVYYREHKASQKHSPSVSESDEKAILLSN